MIKHIALAAAILVGGLFASTPQDAQAYAGGRGLSLRLGVRSLVRNAIIGAVNQNVVVVNRFGQAVVVNRFGQQVVVNRFGQRVVVQNNFNNFNRFGQRVVVNRFGQAVVVDQRGRAIVQRNVFVQPQRNVRIVEVPNLGVRSNLVVIRDRFGRVVDVRRQNVINVRGFNSRVLGNRIIIEQNLIRGR